MSTYRLVMSCPDGVGIVAAVSQFIASHGGWIMEANHHSDLETGRFFMRHVIKAESLPFKAAEFATLFAPIAEQYQLDWRLVDTAKKHKVMLMASKEAHCLVDILSRWHAEELDCEIVGVISNHADLQNLVEWYGIPYHYVPVNSKDKAPSFAQVNELIEASKADTIVLARYMQIIPPNLCEHYQNRIINIHHSFLPSFIGAKPYHQASLRGVKLIGATCHYVTEELDAGPIIEQDVIRVSHADSVKEMVRRGKDIEKIVLSRGLRYHLEDRVIVQGNKTVVF